MNIVDWAQDNIDFKGKAFMHPKWLLKTIDQLVALLTEQSVLGMGKAYKNAMSCSKCPCITLDKINFELTKTWQLALHVKKSTYKDTINLILSAVQVAQALHDWADSSDICKCQ